MLIYLTEWNLKIFACVILQGEPERSYRYLIKYWKSVWGIRDLESVPSVSQEQLMLSQNGPEASQCINRFHLLVIHNVPSCASALLILDRVTSLRQGHCCPIRVAVGCKVLPTHLPAPCWTHHLSSYSTLILFIYLIIYFPVSLFVFQISPYGAPWLTGSSHTCPLTEIKTHACLTYI